MNAFALPLVLYYFLVFGLVCVYGLHRYWIVWIFWKTRKDGGPRESSNRFSELPRITVQLPMFNEMRVAERVIEAACKFDYPGELLQIQVLDDSTDESAAIAKACCQRMTENGHDVQFIHRTDRAGFKAGALEGALSEATGEFIAIFDADFVPPPDLLQRIIHEFTDKQVGMVQTCWAHLNREDSALTRLQAMFLDGHFIIEQAARARSGKWFNFNGTAGIWRRSCIEEAGGWQHDTLTEDTDLSYRAQLAGWNFIYRDDVTCPAEIPPTMGAFLTQQHRWNKGLIQTAIKLMPRIMRSDAPWGHKIEAWFHLTSPIVHVAILLLVTLVVPSLFMTLPLEHIEWTWGVLYGSVFLLLGAAAACTFYIASQVAQKRSLLRTLAQLPALLAVGVGITVLNSKAICEAIMGKKSPFVRTPKYNGAQYSPQDPLAAKKKRRLPGGTIEIILGILMTGCFLVALTRPFSLVGAPFILLFASGYLIIGVATLRDQIRQSAIESGERVLRETSVNAIT